MTTLNKLRLVVALIWSLSLIVAGVQMNSIKLPTGQLELSNFGTAPTVLEILKQNEQK